MPNRSTQQAMAKSTYIPPQIQHAMENQMRQSLPPHLQQYVGAGRPAYVPKNIQNQLTQQMQKTMPGHLSQYAGAYVQQKVAEPSFSAPMQSSGQTLKPHPPVPNLMRKDHDMPYGEQHSVEISSLPKSTGSSFDSPAPGQAGPDPNPQASPPYPPQNDGGPKPPSYDFIFSSNENNKNGLQLPKLPGLNGSMNKLVMFLVGAFVLVLLLVVIKSVLSGPSNFPYLLSVAQDQVEIIHLATAAPQQTDITDANRNYSSTAQLAVASSNASLLHYLQLIGHKVSSSKQLNLKVSASTDQNLTNAELAGNFNQVYDQVNASLLQSYINDLKAAYNHTAGKNGRALLSSDYNQALLLLTQINSASNS